MPPSLAEQVPPPRPLAARLPFYYGWVNVVLAAVAMSATLPGRTHGLGLIAKPLTEDPGLGVDDRLFSALNFWAILLGSALCLPAGRLIDRLGVRVVLVAVAAGLGAATLGMSRAAGVVALFLTLLLVRGLGQGALSVVSMALVGKWFARRLGLAMAVFTVLLAFGFIAGTVGVGAAVQALGWRPAWAWVGLALLLGLAPLGWLLARDSPEQQRLAVEGEAAPEARPALPGLSLGAALRSPGFWAFTLSAALFNLVWSAITLFNEKLLDERGFNNATFIRVMAVLVVSGLPANLVAGWLAGRWPMGRIQAVGMGLLAVALAAFPWVRTETQVLLYAAALGVAGGIITVIFFAVYGHAFGRAHLGAIQAVVQVVSVLASAAGPVLLTWYRAATGSSDGLFHAAAPAAVALGLAVRVVRLPSAGLPEPARAGP
jgi:MFS family permease